MEVEKTRKSKLGRDKRIWGALFVAPQMAGAAVFMAFPILFSVVLSFSEWNFAGTPKLIGLDNFRAIFSHPTFYTSFINTLIFVAIVVPFNLVFSLAFAMLLDHKIVGRTLFRTLYFLPNVTSSIAVSLVWIWIYNPDFGMLNGLLARFGLPPGQWIYSLKMAIPSISITIIWASCGHNIIIFLAGLNNISQVLYEAAEIDGANWWQRFFRITVPMLSPTMFFVVIMGFIGAFQIFNQPFMMTNGGPGEASHTLVLWLYFVGFRFYRMGEAAVISMVLFVLIAAVTFVQFKLQDKWVNYDV